MFLAKIIYNLLLEEAKKHYKEKHETLSKFDMNSLIKKIKEEQPVYKKVHSQALQNVSDRLSKAFQNFFRRVKQKKLGGKVKVGYPRFKKFVSSLTYPQTGFKLTDSKVLLSKIGGVKIVKHRELEGIPKTLTIKQSKSGKWFASITVEIEDKPFKSNDKPAVGMDLGLKELAVLSDGVIIPNNHIKKKLESKEDKLHRRVSLKKKGSVNRLKARLKLSKFSEKMTNKNNDFLHKLSHFLVNSYSFIAYEDLNINGMIRNHRLAKSISQASWGKLIQLLQYKAESAGCVTVGVNPKNTSQTCSNCGNKEELKLSDRVFNCVKCGLTLDRDLNASKNILKKALEGTAGRAGSNAFGDSVRPFAKERLLSLKEELYLKSLEKGFSLEAHPL